MTALARGHYLRPNGLGGYIIRQSDLSSWSRCQLEKWYNDRAENEVDAPKPAALSATEWGSVLHYCLMNMEQAFHEGNEDALELGLRLFQHYWDLDNMTTLPGVRKITEWLPRQTYGGLRERGRIVLRTVFEMLRTDRSWPLALEYQFAVPLELDGRTHTVTGTVDRLSIREATGGKPYVSLDDYKGLWVETPLPTPTGWTTMGQVQVGDQLLGADGHPVRVTHKSSVHQRPCYRLTFDDRSSIVADNVHLWTVDSGPANCMRRETISTEEMARRAGRGEVFRIPNAAPLRTRPRDLPIDPYVLGQWLGDGNRGRGVITSGDGETFRLIEERGYALGRHQVDRVTQVTSRTVLGLQACLRQLGLLGNKSVPSQYLRADWRQRLDLLRGLMDSDGSWNRGRRHAVFTNTDEGLANAVRELVVSLGWKARTSVIMSRGFGKTVRTFLVNFTPVDHNPFLLARKAALVDTLNYSMTERPRRRKVVSVEPVPTVPTQCIEVDAPDSLFLCGEQMLPTHNSGKQKTYLRYNMQGTVYAWASTLPEFWLGWPESGMGALETFDDDLMGRLDALFSRWGYRHHRGTHRELPLASRRFRWINLQEAKFVDGGWRVDQDYERMKLAIDAYIRANEAGIYSVNTEGEICRYCSFKNHCGGVGLAPETAGAP